MITAKRSEQLYPVLKNWDILAADPDWREYIVGFLTNQRSDFQPKGPFKLTGHIYDRGNRFPDGSKVATSTIQRVDRVHRTGSGILRKFLAKLTKNPQSAEYEYQQSLDYCVTTHSNHRYYFASKDMLPDPRLAAYNGAAATGIVAAV